MTNTFYSIHGVSSPVTKKTGPDSHFLAGKQAQNNSNTMHPKQSGLPWCACPVGNTPNNLKTTTTNK